MKELDLSTWKRREHFDYFREMEYPHFGLSASVDVSGLLEFCRRGAHSFYHSMMHCATATAESIEEFRYRVRGDKVVIHDHLYPSFTYLKDEDLFDFCALDYQPDLLVFLEAVRSKLAEPSAGKPLEEDRTRDDYLFITCLPWVHFTGITHPIRIRDCDSIPRLAWGKYELREGRSILPFSIQAHHALVDGVHMGRFFVALQARLDLFEATKTTEAR